MVEPNNLDRLCLENNQLEESIPASLTNLSAEIKLDFSEEVNKCHRDDWEGLKALFTNTGALEWEEKESWVEILLQNEPPADCDLEDLKEITLRFDGRVKTINLRSNNLTGKIPGEIDRLSFLSELYLNGNYLTGSLPIELSNLKNLTKLDLSSNPLDITFPVFLTELNNLENLNLRGTGLKGSIPSTINKLTDLVYLYLSGNELEGNIPAVLGDLNNLEYLYLGGNNLSGAIPKELGKLVNLWHLDLSNNQLSGSIPKELGDMHRINVLHIRNNELSGTIPKELGKASSLRSLSLQNNQIKGDIPVELADLKYLENLYLTNNELTGEIPTGFGVLTYLEELDLSENQLTGVIPPGMSDLSNLTEVNLRNNSLNGVVPKFPEAVETVNLQYNNFNCGDLEEHYDHNRRIKEFRYEPQKQLIGEIENNVYVIDPDEPESIVLKIDGLPLDSKLTWQSNDFRILGENSNSLIINNPQPTDAGIYTLEVKENCLLNIRKETEPIYVIVKGYDFYGQPVEYNQIMVEFEDVSETKEYVDEILLPNGGIERYKCNCSRELYLWEFPSTEKALIALLEIDKKIQKIQKRTKANGGFNNSIKIGEGTLKGTAFHVPNQAINNNYEVNIFILDSGLDEANRQFLIDQAPVDSCYNVDQSAGYNYTDTNSLITNEYSDDLWHGTFGYHAITNGLDTNQSKIKTIPLKVFDENGKGNLFKLTCAIYHAIDHNADIINISAGYQGEPSKILENAMFAAHEKGIFICTAAGNENQDIDSLPQYPAYYAGKYHIFTDIDTEGKEYEDSLKLDNVVSVAAIDSLNNLCNFSNYGSNSVTLSAYGENIHSYGLKGSDVVASGTSMATYFVSRELAMEIAADKTIDYQTIWNNFERNRLFINPSTIENTITGKRLDVEICEAEIKGCTDEEACNYFPFATENDGTCNTDCFNCDKTIFESYDWLSFAENCDSIIAYEGILNNYIYLIKDTIATLFNEEGIVDCEDEADYSCIYSKGLHKIACAANCSIVGVKMYEELYFSVYPNPGQNKVMIQLNNKSADNYQLNIFDLHGKPVQSFSVNGVNKVIDLDVSNYPKGIYFIEAKNKKGFYIQKLVKD